MDEQKIRDEFQRIKNLGFVKSRRAHNTGIGKTFEDYLGVDENNLREPDFAGFEVKSQREKTNSYLSLFTKTPTHVNPNLRANTYLRDTYGQANLASHGFKKLHTSIFENDFNAFVNKFGFKIELNDEKIYIKIKNLATGAVETPVYWTYDEIKKCINHKLNALFYVSADSRVVNNEEEFHYTTAKICYNPSIEKLLNLIRENKIMIDIRIGSYKSGKNIGAVHDHGTGFRIKASDLHLLYDTEIVID